MTKPKTNQCLAMMSGSEAHYDTRCPNRAIAGTKYKLCEHHDKSLREIILGEMLFGQHTLKQNRAEQKATDS